MEQFIANAVQEYIAALNAGNTGSVLKEYFALSAKPGKKYTRIVALVRRTYGPGAGELQESSVHAFLENATGKIYKPAGWAGPVKYGAAYDLTDPKQFASLLEDASQPHAFAGGYLYSGAQSWRRSA